MLNVITDGHFATGLNKNLCCVVVEQFWSDLSEVIGGKTRRVNLAPKSAKTIQILFENMRLKGFSSQQGLVEVKHTHNI